MTLEMTLAANPPEFLAVGNLHTIFVGAITTAFVESDLVPSPASTRCKTPPAL